ncbi:BREX-2 system phosphatase PglZ [Streptantibioticus rubrisoli]|uniref:BREX-2 system phosphatase PglZ n=1 Tax=Streptantibioticus rubrisoli TaxID=1387313 RepID=A0ABT1PCZ4_9ACTN|nr:BREX-2 system phosphatase PglZ [Streptantibioticus rubrisoli]MCQ4043242.1 BREX-2 system phosphatase PglZ [Streptantibioticus rubrisoli]
MSTSTTTGTTHAGTSAVRLNTTTVTQYLASQSGLATGKRKAVLLRAAPVWDGAAQIVWGERRARVATGGSPLAVLELVLGHLAPGAAGPEVLVVLTDREESELGADLLARVHKQRVNAVDIWDVVREAFGAQGTDRALAAENWAAEALLDATPPGGWPQLGKGLLPRRYALAALALRRLGAGVYDPDVEGRSPGGVAGAVELDVHTLLRWSLAPCGPERFLALRAPEQDGLTRFLGEEEQAGLAGRALLALVAAEHGSDAVAFGLVCAALWVHADDSADAEDYRARGRAERWFGDPPPAQGQLLDAMVAAFGRACEEFVTALLASGRSGSAEDMAAARRMTAAVLDRASALSRQFGAERACGTSPLLRAGLEARFTAVGHALAARDAARVEFAVRELERHRLAADEDAHVRVERARMAQRLTRWLATGPAADHADETTQSVTDAINGHVAETGWVDLALEHVAAGGDPTHELKAAYDALCSTVRERRRAIDQRFARDFGTWASTGGDTGTMLTVESFLSRVVAPVVKDDDVRVLLIVLDGMSAAIAAEFGEELRRDWAEYDPVRGAKDTPRRRGMAAALPTVTAVSRTSLFAGRLMTGSQRDEAAIFRRHAFWGGRDVAVFHKDDLRADSGGDAFSPALQEAMSSESTHVAVVLNTIDDRLAKEQKLGDASWRTADIGGLRELLSQAAVQGRAVILTSDHGHVIDRYGVRVEAATPLSARHRAPGGPIGENEIELSGPRVVSPETGGSIVALWDADSRYTALKAGYHGGASLAEVAIPVLAFMRFGAEPPRGWRELGGQQPVWWNASTQADKRTSAPGPKTRSRPARRATTRRQSLDASASGAQSLFEVTMVPDGEHALFKAEAIAPDDALVTALVDSELFQAQRESLARKPDPAKVEQAVRELLGAGGTLPVTALAQRIGLPTSRADGFCAVLRQLLNFDGVQVLEMLADGRTLRLNRALLREQFELGRGPGS